VADTTTITLPEGFVLSEFRPVAYFDKHMDCIRVTTHDRSVTEHRINEFYTIYENNNPGSFDPKYIGFTIKGIRALFNEIGIPLEGSYKLADVIDRLVKHRPGSIMSETLSLIFNQHRVAGDLPVDLDHAA
jgi:hypothetical protein